jgi:hypothetical protein
MLRFSDTACERIREGRVPLPAEVVVRSRMQTKDRRGSLLRQGRLSGAATSAAISASPSEPRIISRGIVIQRAKFPTGSCNPGVTNTCMRITRRGQEAAAHASFKLCPSYIAYHDSKKSPKDLPLVPVAHLPTRYPATPQSIHPCECVNMNRADQGRATGAEVGAKTVREAVVPLCSTADRQRAPTSRFRPGHRKSNC